MGNKVKLVFDFIDAVTEKTGKAISLLALLLMVVSVTEVIARYVFNNPTTWAWLTNRQLFAVFVLFGGVYALLYGRHIRVEILYNRFSPKMKSVAKLIALACLLSFIGVLVWQGSWMAADSISVGERAHETFRIPLYPLKTLIPIVAFLFLLQGIAVFFRGERQE
jgi:TRAP-type mannitol/chloroaromatic compound transport system permease small subunit